MSKKLKENMRQEFEEFYAARKAEEKAAEKAAEIEWFSNYMSDLIQYATADHHKNYQEYCNEKKQQRKERSISNRFRNWLSGAA